MTRSLSALACLAAVASACASSRGDSRDTVTARSSVTVFAPGVVSTGEPTLFRGSFSPNGRHFYFFRKVGEGGEDYRIYRTSLEGADWSPAEMLPLGDGVASQLYPTVSPDGRTLVFSAYRSGMPADTFGNANLWSVPLVDGQPGEPEFLASLSTLPNYDAGPVFRSDGALRFTSTSPDWSSTEALIARKSPSAWSDAEIDTFDERWVAQRPELHVWGSLVSPAGDLAIIEVSTRDENGRPHPGDLWLARKGADGWSRMKPLGPEINTAGTENFAVFSPDGSHVYFVRDFTTYFQVEVSAF